MPKKKDQNIKMSGSVYVGGAVGGSVVNISGNKTQVGVEDLKSLLKELKSLLESTPLSDESKSEMEAEIKTVEAQLGSPKPKQKIINEGLKTIRSIAEGVLGNAAFTAIVVGLKQFISG